MIRGSIRVLGILIAATVIQAGAAHATVTTDITVGAPTANGVVKFNIVSANAGGIGITASANILATDTAAMKASKVAAAVNAAPGNIGAWTAVSAGPVVTVTQIGGGGMTVTPTADTTGEGGAIKVTPGGGNGQHWFWRFVHWLVSSNASVVPAGTVLAISSTNGFSATVTADGVRTVSQLFSDITSQLQGQGLVFNPDGTSQSFAFDLSGTEQGLTVSSNWFTYFGGGPGGVELVAPPATSAPALGGHLWPVVLALGILATLLQLRRQQRAARALAEGVADQNQKR
jgi:hypothetical protein